jgi:hypothetical protein
LNVIFSGQVADPTLASVAIPQHAVLDVQPVQGRIVDLVQHDLGDPVRHLQLADFRFIAVDTPDVIAVQRDGWFSELPDRWRRGPDPPAPFVFIAVLT